MCASHSTALPASSRHPVACVPHSARFWASFCTSRVLIGSRHRQPHWHLDQRVHRHLPNCCGCRLACLPATASIYQLRPGTLRPSRHYRRLQCASSGTTTCSLGNRHLQEHWHLNRRHCTTLHLTSAAVVPPTPTTAANSRPIRYCRQHRQPVWSTLSFGSSISSSSRSICHRRRPATSGCAIWQGVSLAAADCLHAADAVHSRSIC